MNEFWKRTIFGALYVLVIIGSIVGDPVVFASTSCVLALLAVREYNKLLHPRNISDILCDFCAVLLVFSSAMQCSIGFYELISIKILFAYFVCLALVLIIELWRKAENPVANWGNILVGQVMLAGPFVAMNALLYISKWLLLALFVLIWVNDSGAYCVGSLTAKRKNGNHKMFPRVSPKKSWEGLFGGFAFAIGAAFVMNHFGWFDTITADADGWKANVIVIAFALIACIFGTLGDLMESLFKRTIGVKDSGKFLPGHGGVLDRFDSMLLAAPMVAIFCWLCYRFSFPF